MNFLPDITKLERVTAPESLLTLDEAKNHLRVDHDDEDSLISSLIAAVCQMLDGETGLYGFNIGSQVWKWTGYPRCYKFEIEMPNVTAITEVKYYNSSNTLITDDLANWELAANNEEAYIWPVSGAWPTFYWRWDAFQIKYSVGFTEIPADIKQAALLIIAAMYDNRGDADFTIPAAAQALINQRRKGWCG